MLTDTYVDASMTEFRQGWRGWQERARRVLALAQPTLGRVRSSSTISGVPMTKVEAATAQAAEYSSARCASIERNFIGRGIAVPPKIEPLVLEEGKQDQAAQRKLFMMLGGIHNVLDAHVQTTAQGLSWDERVLKSIFHFGKAVIFPHARYRGSGESEEVEFTAEIADPLCVMHDFDSWPRRIVKEMTVGGADAERLLTALAGPAELGTDGGLTYPRSRLRADGKAAAELRDRDGKLRDSVLLTDFWCAEQMPAGGGREYRVWHAVRINNVTAGCWETGFDHLPPVIQVAHASPSSYQDVQAGSAAQNAWGSTRGLTADRVLYHAEGFLAPLLKVEADFLQMMSLIAEGSARVLNPGEDVTLSEGATAEDVPPDEQSGPGARRIHVDNVKIALQETVQAQIGEALRIYFEKADEEYERLFPSVNFGQSNPGDAGYLQVIKTNAASAVVQESIRAASLAGKRTFEELIAQWKRQDLRFHVDGWRQNGKAGPQDFEGGDFTSADFPPQYVLNYQLNFDLPPNEAAKAEVARAMKEGRWMSDREIEVNVFDNPDPDKTRALIEQQEYEASPAVMQRKMLYQMRQEMAALEDAAEEAEDVAERNGLLLELEYAKQDYAIASGQAPTDTGTPKSASGFSPSTMPPEMGVGTNADRNAQASGRATASYTGGRPPRTKAA